MTVLIDQTGEIAPAPRTHYLEHSFEVPEGTVQLTATLTFSRFELEQLGLSLFSPEGYRGTRVMKSADRGEVTIQLDLAHLYASPGGISGDITPGRWRAKLDVLYPTTALAYRLIVATGSGPVPTQERYEPTGQNGRVGAGYYRGELHTHSVHSDGETSVAEVVTAARQYGLDFLALTDHFTNSGWAELESLAGADLAVLKGMEVTGHAGHANLHGLSAWVDPFIDAPDGSWAVNDAAAAAHAQGGLFCVNHAFAPSGGWQYYGFDWSYCDLLEVYHHLTGVNNAAQLGLWDGLLNRGYRITGVAGTDSHHPHLGRQRLGQVATYVYADGLEPKALITGLKRGRSYISLGPTLEFSAVSEEQHAFMGQTLQAHKDLKLEVIVDQLDRPARLVLLKNGLRYAHEDLPVLGNAHCLTFEDAQPVPGYYRLELYELSAQPSPDGGREWDKTLLLSNPVYIER